MRMSPRRALRPRPRGPAGAEAAERKAAELAGAAPPGAERDAGAGGRGRGRNAPISNQCLCISCLLSWNVTDIKIYRNTTHFSTPSGRPTPRAALGRCPAV